MASVRHYLLLDVKNRLVIHHERAADGGIATRIAHEGRVRLDPPGIALDVASLFTRRRRTESADTATPRGRVPRHAPPTLP